MLSDRLGGSGKNVNLVPGTNSMNQKHFNQVEKVLINTIGAGGVVHTYKSTPLYNGGTGGLKSKRGKRAYKDTMALLICNAVYTDPVAGKKTLNTIISERAGISKKANWKGK